MKEKIKVIQYGIGAMGSVMAKIILQKKELELVGAVSRSQAGKDLGNIIGKNKIGVKVYSPKDIFNKVKADIVLHAANSYVPEVWKQVAQAVKKRMNIITIAEEMGYPYIKYPKISKEMDRAAKKYNVTILGTGINPGFAMDLMPLLLTGICKKVNSIKVTRLIDFAPFGRAIQNNIGIGLDVKEFKKRVAKGTLPLHIGLPESTYMLADALGWKLDKIKETREPVAMNKTIKVPGYMTIKPKKVCGFNHRCFGIKNGKKIIILEELGRVDPKLNYQNTIIIKGIPNLKEIINVPSGDITTTSHAVNLIPIVINAKPGLVTMKDLPVAPVIQ